MRAVLPRFRWDCLRFRLAFSLSSRRIFDDVVRGEELAVRAGGADLERVVPAGMNRVGCLPAIA